MSIVIRSRIAMSLICAAAGACIALLGVGVYNRAHHSEAGHQPNTTSFSNQPTPRDEMSSTEFSQEGMRWCDELILALSYAKPEIEY